MPEKKTENQGIKLDHTDIILDRIKIAVIINLDQLRERIKIFSKAI